MENRETASDSAAASRIRIFRRNLKSVPVIQYLYSSVTVLFQPSLNPLLNSALLNVPHEDNISIPVVTIIKEMYFIIASVCFNT